MLALFKKWQAWLVVSGVLAIAFGVLCSCFLPFLWQRANALAREPQRITLHDLATKGVGDNPHVIVTDFSCGEDYVFEITARNGAPRPDEKQAGFGRAWIPLFPKDDGPAPTRFTVLLETTPTLASGQGFHALSRRQSMEGLAMPLSQRGLKHDVRTKLAAGYPDTEFETCLMLVQFEPREKEDARFFAMALSVFACGGFAVGLIVIAIGVFFGFVRQTAGTERRSGGGNGKNKVPSARRG